LTTRLGRVAREEFDVIVESRADNTACFNGALSYWIRPIRARPVAVLANRISLRRFVAPRPRHRLAAVPFVVSAVLAKLCPSHRCREFAMRLCNRT
jgi:hypothetical protein